MRAYGGILAIGAGAVLLAMFVAAVVLPPLGMRRPERVALVVTGHDSGYRSVPPGQEEQVAAALAGLRRRGLAGWQLADVRILGAAIRVRLAAAHGAVRSTCALPAWASPDGGLEILRARNDDPLRGAPLLVARRGGLVVRLFACGDASTTVRTVALDGVAADLASTNLERVWSLAAGPGFAFIDTSVVAPAARATGASLAAITLGGWSTGLVVLFAAAVLGWARGRRAGVVALPAKVAVSPDAHARFVSLVIVLVVLGGIALRLHAAATMPLESDESWAFPTAQAVLGLDHDALVHPPLYRGVAQTWARMTGWQPGDPALLLRLPSVVAGSAALALLGLLARRARSAWAVAPITVLALAGSHLGACALARPYALASLLFAIAVVLAAERPDEPPRVADAIGAVLAAALLAWCDLPAGVAAIVTLALLYAARARRDVPFFALLSVGYLAIASPLLPGGVAAWTEGPARDAIGRTRHMLPEVGIGHAQWWPSLVGLASSLSAEGSPLVGGACFLFMVGFAWHRGARVIAGWTVALALLLATLATHALVRDRNVAFFALVPPFAMLLALGHSWRSAPGRRVRVRPLPDAAQ